MVTVTVVVDSYRTRPEPLKVSSRAAKVARRLRSSTYAKLYVYDTLLKRWVQDLEDMPPALRPFIQEAPAVVRQRHLAPPGEVPAADQAHI